MPSSPARRDRPRRRWSTAKPNMPAYICGEPAIDCEPATRPKSQPELSMPTLAMTTALSMCRFVSRKSSWLSDWKKRAGSARSVMNMPSTRRCSDVCSGPMRLSAYPISIAITMLNITHAMSAPSTGRALRCALANVRLRRRRSVVGVSDAFHATSRRARSRCAGGGRRRRSGRTSSTKTMSSGRRLHDPRVDASRRRRADELLWHGEERGCGRQDSLFPT